MSVVYCQETFWVQVKISNALIIKDISLHLVLKNGVELTKVFFPILAWSCTEGRAAAELRMKSSIWWNKQCHGWFTKEKKKEVKLASTGQLTFYCSSTPWHTPPLRHQTSPLLLVLSRLDKNVFSDNSLAQIAGLHDGLTSLHYFSIPLPCSLKPSSFAKSEAILLQSRSSSPPPQSGSPSHT